MASEKEIREELEATYDKVYNTDELTSAFAVIGFQAPYVVVEEKATGRKGTLAFDHMPRFYYDFRPM